MAVEIPVVVDIMGGIDDSIKQLPKAIKKLQTEVDSYPVEAKIRINVEGVEETNDELKQLKEYFQEMEDADWEKIGKDLDFTPYINQSIMELRSLEKQLQEIQDLRQMEGGGTDFAKELADAHKNIREQAAAVARAIAAMEEMQKSFKASGTGINDFINSQYNEVEKRRAQWKALYAELEDYSEKYASSINAIRNRVSELEQTWANMTKAERNASRDEMVNKYKKGVSELKNEAKTLREIFQEQERLANLVKQTSQNRRYENAVLKMNGDSIRILSEQQRILTERLNKAKFGTDEFGRYKQQLEEVRQKLQQVQGGVNNVTGAMQRQSGVLRNLTGTLSSYVSIFGLLRFAKQIRDVTGELEYQRVALGHLIQDEEYGAKLFERIKQAAIESPFRIKDLVTYTKQLAAYRIEQENLFDTTQRLADISAGLGVDMNRLILAYGQVRAASVLRGQELRQFTEAGIPLVELLAEKMGELNKTTYTTADVFKLISERAVPFSAISEIFEDLTDKGGMFYEMQERQAETLKGRWEKLKDAFDIGIQAAGETKTFEWQNNLVLSILNVLAKNIRIVPKLVEALGFAWATYNVVTGVTNLRNKAIAKSTTQVMTASQLMRAGVNKNVIALLGKKRASEMLIRAQTKLAASTNFLSKAMAKLNLALLTNPYTAIAAAVVGVASAFLFWRKSSQDTTTALDELDDRIEDVSNATKKFERSEKLIDRYKELASNTNRTTQENTRLQKTMSQLVATFPELAENINLENENLEQNVALLKSRNEYLLKQSKERAAESLILAREDLQKYSKAAIDAEKEWAKAEAEATLYLDGRKYEDLYRSQQRAYDRLRKKAREEEKKMLDSQELRDNASKRIETLERYLAPNMASAFETAWQNTLARMKDVKVGGKTISLISDSDIREYESIYKALTKIDKAYKDSSESLKEMKASLSSVSDEYKEQAQDEIRTEQARRDGYKAILDTFGYISSIDKKKGVSDLTLLKEELKTVQDIYKKYQEFVKYLGEAGAKQKIEQIYGGVTAIDFLSPELFKKRISTILGELRVLQGRIKSGTRQLSADMAADLKAMLRGNEGFMAEAKKVFGEEHYSIGYGFYNKLVDGTKITEGMKMTREQAEAELDKQVARTVGITNNLIEKYGKGMKLTDKQFNILADLAYQGPKVLERILKSSDGDVEKLAKELESAASKYVKDAAKAGVRKRDMRRAQLFRLAGAEETEDADAVAQAVGEAEKLVQDVDWDEYKKKLDEQLKRISSDIKRSETARNFYNDILGLTGDNELAASLTMSVYGTEGEEFADRIKKQLVDSLSAVDANTFAGLSESIIKAFDEGDYKYLMEHLEEVPEKLRDTVKQVASDSEKYNADWLKNFYQTYQKAKTFEERIDTENALRRQKLAETTARGASQSDLAAINEYYDRKIAEIQLEAIKDTDEWAKAFEDLEGVSTETLDKLITLLDEYIEKYGKVASPGSLRTVVRSREQVNDQRIVRTAYGKTIEAIKKYGEALKRVRKTEKGTKEHTEALSDAAKQLSNINKGVDAIADSFSQVGNIISGLSDFLELDDLSYLKAGLDGVAKTITLIGTALAAVSALMKIAAPEMLAISAAIALVISAFKVWQNIRITKANREIEKQSDLLEDLEYQYGRLQVAMEKSFGSDYITNYNQQIDTLLAKREAYMKQAEAERSKAKNEKQYEKKYKEQTEQYLKSAREVEDQIRDMQTQLSEFFSGTDLTSAAKDFASAWIDAYKEFGSVTDAMGEKFRDMIQEMVQNSVAAQVMQQLLQPIFDEIDTLAREGGELSVEDIAAISKLASDQIPAINDAMTTLMNSLRAAGYNIREQPGQFTGISRNIANATEESITGLAAGINTQNFYMSMINQNVAAILAVISGGAVPAEGGVSSVQFNNELALQHLSGINDKLSSILNQLDKVIKPTSVSAQYYVAVRQ